MPWRRARVLPSGSVGREAPKPTGRSCVRVALCPDPFPFGRSVHRRSSASTSFVLASLRALHVDPLLGDGGSGAQGEMGVWDVCKLGRSGEGPEVYSGPLLRDGAEPCWGLQLTHGNPRSPKKRWSSVSRGKRSPSSLTCCFRSASLTRSLID